MVSQVNLSWFKGFLTGKEDTDWVSCNTVNTPDTQLQNDTKSDTCVTVCSEMFLLYMFVCDKWLEKLFVTCWCKKKKWKKEIALPLSNILDESQRSMIIIQDYKTHFHMLSTENIQTFWKENTFTWEAKLHKTLRPWIKFSF